MEGYLLPHQRDDWEPKKDLLMKVKESEITSLDSLNKALFQKNNLRTVEKYLDLFKKDNPDWFINSFLPKLASLALNIETILPINPFNQKDLSIVSLNKLEISCLLSHAFFGFLSKFPGASSLLSFTTILQSTFFRHQIHKLASIINYFERIFNEIDNPNNQLQNYIVTFERKQLSIFPDLSKSEKKLSEFFVHAEGEISDAENSLYVDFANEKIGGLVLKDGMVQEEIHFTVHPECFISMLFSSPMKANEVIYIRGAKKYSNYSGYGSSFKFEGNCESNLQTRKILLENEEKLQYFIDIVAMDAVPYSLIGRDEQWNIKFFHREIYKAFNAFNISHWEFEPKPTCVSTGNWGCGMFGGHKQWKALIQWIAASESDVNVHFYTHNSESQASQLDEFITLLREHQISVSQLYLAMTEKCKNPVFTSDIFAVIKDNLKIK